MSKEQINSRVLTAVSIVLDTHKELTKTAIAQLLGIKPSTFTEILKGRMNASSELMALPSETSAQPLHAAEKDKVADDSGESPANKARDFGSLLAGKVADGKKKRRRITVYKIFSASGGDAGEAGS